MKNEKKVRPELSLSDMLAKALTLFQQADKVLGDNPNLMRKTAEPAYAIIKPVLQMNPDAFKESLVEVVHEYMGPIFQVNGRTITQKEATGIYQYAQDLREYVGMFCRKS